MSIIEKLMEGAVADVDLLYSLDSQGDDFRRFRDVDFLLRCPSKEKAELVSSFINDYRYGVAKPIKRDNDYGIEVVINMPVQQNIILSVSGFMTCIAELYGLEFDGWGCVPES